MVGIQNAKGANKMIVPRISMLVGFVFLVGLSLTGATSVSHRQQSASASAALQNAAKSDLDRAVVAYDSHSDECPGGDAPANCCHLADSCGNLQMLIEPLRAKPRPPLADRIVSKDIFPPATLAPGVDTPPPKA